MNLQESIRRVLKEEDYSPAGKKITPNSIIVHKSNPMFRDKIMEEGLKVRAGECYKIFVGYGVKCKPAIFATNSTNKRAWFDSTYDDDIWFIDTRMIPDVKWYKDRHFESTKKHIVTFQDIPKEALTLHYEGTGSGDVKTWDKNSPNLYESIRRILREKLDKKQKVFYTFSELKNHWVDDNDRTYHDEFFDNKDYEDFYFDNFYDMDEMFGHENSLFGTRGLPVGHPNRSSKSFDYYNKKFGPMIVRVIKNNDLQESIRRILKEENNLIHMIRRRVPHGDLDKEFEDSLNMSSNMLRNTYKDNGNVMSLERFIQITISILIDSIHYELYSTLPDEYQWYNEVKETLKEYYKDKIETKYRKLISEI